MHDGIPPLLADWSSFYVIIGSSGAALTGLMFVVVALVADKPQPDGRQGLATFGTPTVLHMCAAFLIAAVLSAPWHRLESAAITIGAAGGAGALYTIVIARRAHRVTIYQPVLEDWIWHTILPMVAYLTILGAAILLTHDPSHVLFGLGAATVLLLFIGVHNAWDTVTYLAIKDDPPGGAGAPPGTSAGA